MTGERRTTDRRVTPAVGEFAVQERAQLQATIADQSREIEKLGAGIPRLQEQIYQARKEIAALKAQSSGVVLPTVEQLATALGKVRRFHDLSAELIAPDLLENLRAVVGSEPVSAGAVMDMSAEQSMAISKRGREAIISASAGVVDERAAIQSDISCDSAYRNGLIAGFNFGINDDEAGYQRSLACYQSEIHEARAALSEPSHGERAHHVVPDGWVMVPQEIHLGASDIELINGMCGDGNDESGYGPYQDGTLYIGYALQDDGSKVYGLHISCDECPEEGVTTLAEFATAPSAGSQGGDV